VLQEKFEGGRIGEQRAEGAQPRVSVGIREERVQTRYSTVWMIDVRH
jgi:hypothetical protein